jgi:hypothetical protein
LIPFYAVITGSGDVASINRREMMGGMAGYKIAVVSVEVLRGGGLKRNMAIKWGVSLFTWK